jgi:hydroxymethylpyrimidine/phosphomethylpyrimidine kinase
MLPIALTIAGSDSGGGAGIQADLKTFHQFGVYGATAVVAVTAQNTRGVRAVHPIPHDVVEAQLEALADDLPPHAVKSGMLATASLVDLVAAAIRRHCWTSYVLDPVIVASSGDRLLEADAIGALRDRLLPLALLVTPNLEEAGILAGFPVVDPDAMERAGRALVEGGAGAALIKGGHLDGHDLVDVLVGPDGVIRFPHTRLDTTSTHGTGCTLSAAITAGLARWNLANRGLVPPLPELVGMGLDFVHRAIAAAPGLGRGRGPVNHFV